jgi:hypothetical protein
MTSHDMRRNEVSTPRLYVMRMLYLLLVLMLGSDVWPTLIHPTQPLGPLDGVAYSFWAALSTLGLLGIRYPLAMLPVLMLQFLYKAVWLLFIWLPLRSQGQFPPGASGLVFAISSGLVLDLLVIPWPYVVEHYLRRPGDRWKVAAPASPSRLEAPTSERARSAAH